MAESKGDSVDGRSTLENEKHTLPNYDTMSPTESVAEKGKDNSPPKGATRDEPIAKPPPVESELKPVSFLSLFKFATKTEIALNIVGTIAACAAGAAQPLMSLLFGNLTTSFVNFGNEHAATQVPNPSPEVLQAFAEAQAEFKRVAAKDAGLLAVIGVATLLASYIYMTTFVYTGEVNAKRIRERYLKSVLRQDIAFFDTLGAGEVATRIQVDTHLIQQGISEKVALVFHNIASFITGFVLAYIRSWRLALALSSILPCIMIIGTIMNKFVSKNAQTSIKAVAEGGSLAEEVISTIRTAQAFSTQTTLSKLYNAIILRSFQAEERGTTAHGVGIAGFWFVIYSAYALAFYFGTTLILDGHANAGIIVNVFLAILIGSFALAMLTPELQAISHGRAAAAKIFDTIARVPPIDSASEEGLKPDHVEGHITLENVVFDYPARPDVKVLRGINLDFPAGRTAALVGASGSGKSTIIQLIERFYDPLSGAVKLDGVPLTSLHLRWLRSQIGLVSQEPSLFATTIKRNVAHGLIGSRFEGVGEEEQTKLIKEACIMANAHSFIEKLPDGYDTMVGERGFLLSGGQKRESPYRIQEFRVVTEANFYKERIAIARAIVSDPRILLLDEATSALDTQSEEIVQNALDKAAAGRTTITIAHRLSTIKDAHCIYVMGNGEILQQGTHEELLRNDGAYAQLVKAQKLREKANKSDDVDRIEIDEAGSVPRKMSSDGDTDKEPTFERSKSRNSTHSIASDVLEQRRLARSQAGLDEDKQYSLPYLFYRMGVINKDAWRYYALAFAAACVYGMVYPVFGIVFGTTIQSFQIQDRHQLRVTENRNSLYLFIIAIVTTTAAAAQSYFFGHGSAALTHKLRQLTFKAILRQDIGWFDEERHSTGSLTSSLSDAPQKVNGLAGITLGTIIQSIVTVIGGTIIGLAYGWKLALVALACVPFVVGSGYIRLRIVVMKDQTNKKAHEESAQLACEAAGAIRTVASLTREEDFHNNYSRSLEVPLQRSNRTALWGNWLYAISQGTSFFAIALVFWYGSRLVADLEYTTKNFFICLMSVTFGSIQAGNIFSFVPDMSSAKGAATDIVNLLDTTPEIDAESQEGNHVKEALGRVEFRNVHFRYPTRPSVRVLQGLDLVVEPGTYVALVGASGCGKSTTIQLIERFYDPLNGLVLLDGQNIADLNIQEYRRQIALVSQEPTLYAGTVKFNILLGSIKPQDEVTQDEVENACRSANILEFIQSLPKGFETEVGGKGAQLSGGQKQRIAIARALLRNPKVLLLDEATSALDSQSEKVVQAALDNAAKNRTTIAIAHRLSTIQNADRIYVIVDGKVGEAGTHDELLELKGKYFELVQLQGLSKH